MGKAPAKSEYGSGSASRREGDMRQLSTLLETLPPHAIEAEATAGETEAEEMVVELEAARAADAKAAAARGWRQAADR